MGQDDEYNNERLTTGFWMGTVVGTVFTAPVNYSVYVMGFKYSLPVTALYAGTVLGTITGAAAEMRTYRLGTLTGTIDAFVLTTSQPTIRDGFGSHPVARIEAGDSLVSVIISSPVLASIEGVVGYRLVPGRNGGP
jgi:hypothetical protein